MRFEDDPRQIIFEQHEQELFECPNPLELNDTKLLALEAVVMQANIEIQLSDRLGMVEALHKQQAQRKALISEIRQELDVLAFRDQLDTID